MTEKTMPHPLMQAHKRWSNPRLIWKNNDQADQRNEYFNRKFPKYFGKHSFNFLLLKSNPTFVKMKRLKIIDRLTVTYAKFRRIEQFPYQKPKIIALLRLYSKSLRNLQKGELKKTSNPENFVFAREEIPPYFLENVARPENISLSEPNFSAAKHLSAFRSLKYLLIESWETQKRKFSPKEKYCLEKMVLGLSRLKDLKGIKIGYSLEQENNEWILALLALFDKSAHYLRKDFGLFLNIVHNLPRPANFIVPSPEPSFLILSRITHLKVPPGSGFFLARLGSFESLIHFEVSLDLSGAYDKRHTFVGLKKLRNLKSLNLTINQFSQSGAKDDLKFLLNNFFLPETLEKLNLHFRWTPWHLILPYPQTENITDLLDTNPVLESSEFEDFLSIFARLENLRSFSIEFTNKWEIEYVINRYLAFAIISKIPKLFKLKYRCKNVGGNSHIFPQMDLFMLFESTQHHLPFLTTLAIIDSTVILKKSLDHPSFLIPNLKTFYLSGHLIGNLPLCQLPKLISSERTDEQTIVLSTLFISDNDGFLGLMDSLMKTPSNSKIIIKANIDKISENLLEEQILTFFNQTKREGSVMLDFIVNRENLVIFEKNRKILEESPSSFQLKMDENCYNGKKLFYKTKNFKDILPEWNRFDTFGFLD